MYGMIYIFIYVHIYISKIVEGTESRVNKENFSS